MADYVATTEDFKAVADAIRTKGGTSAPLSFPDEFASAIQAIPVPKPEQEKELTITENGDYPLTPDVGKVLSKAIAHVNVPTGGGGGGFDPAPFKAIEVLTWTPASDTNRNIFKTSLSKPAACFFTAVPGFDGTEGGIGSGYALSINGLANTTNTYAGLAMLMMSASLYEAEQIGMDTGGNKSFRLQAFGQLKFKAGREYIVTVFEI